MKIEVVWEGKSLASHEQTWIDQYLVRTKKYGPVTLKRVKDLKKEKPAAKSTYRIALDDQGKLYSTEALAKLFGKVEASHKGHLQFIIGGAYGLPKEIKQSSDSLLSLSPMTLPHRLALLVLTEQIYRVLSYKAGDPYHHA